MAKFQHLTKNDGNKMRKFKTTIISSSSKNSQKVNFGTDKNVSDKKSEDNPNSKPKKVLTPSQIEKRRRINKKNKEKKKAKRAARLEKEREVKAILISDSEEQDQDVLELHPINRGLSPIQNENYGDQDESYKDKAYWKRSYKMMEDRCASAIEERDRVKKLQKNDADQVLRLMKECIRRDDEHDRLREYIGKLEEEGRKVTEERDQLREYVKKLEEPFLG